MTPVAGSKRTCRRAADASSVSDMFERPVRFKDRADAGRALSERLSSYARRPDVIVLGLPRGGVPVAAEVAAALEVPLDVFLVRKLGVPGQPELAMGAIAEGGIEIVNDSLIRELQITSDQ